MRNKLMFDYLTTMTDYLHRMTGRDKKELDMKIRDIVTNRVQSPLVNYIYQPNYGTIEKRKDLLLNVLDNNSSNIITPSGSIYLPTDKKTSLIGQMVVDKLKERKVYKKKMLEAAAKGDKAEEARCHYRQATIKINCNSLPGGFGSAYNLFYDKGGYNAITSLARALIANAYVTTEQTLGGNFPFYTEDHIVNFIATHLKVIPNEVIISRIMTNYELVVPTKEELLEFYLNTLRNYQAAKYIPKVEQLLTRLKNHEIIWFYYYGNLRNLLWTNEKIFKPWIQKTFDFEPFKHISGDDPNALKDLREDITIILSTILHKELNNKQLFDQIKINPELAGKIAKFGAWLQGRLDSLEELFNTFTYLVLPIQNIQDSPNMWRNTVILSDTDSVIFTTKAWVDWYAADNTKFTDEALHICSLCTYWLTQTMKPSMELFGISGGVSPDKRSSLVMKNEFFYPAMLRFDVKKTYAGIVYIQEGVVLPKPKPDVKGVLLRSSSLSDETTDFAEEILIKEILEPSMRGKISAVELIRKVVAFENKIKLSVGTGETTFLKLASLRNENEYIDADKTTHHYYQIWQSIFANKYGDIRIPSKAPLIDLIPPSKSYLELLKTMDIKIYKDLVEFLETGKRFSFIVINPILDRVPKEIIPLIDVNDIIYQNMSPVYLTLEAIGIHIGHSKKKLLLSDIYQC